MPPLNRRGFISRASAAAGFAALTRATRLSAGMPELNMLSPGLDARPAGAAGKVAYQYLGNIQFDTAKVPFSRYGSYLAFSRLPESEGIREGLYLRTLHGGVSCREIFRLQLVDGENPVPFKEIATPTLLTLQAAGGEVEISIAEPKLVRVRGRGVGLCLAAPHASAGDAYQRGFAIPIGPSHWEVNNSSQRITLMLSSLGGRMMVDAPWEGKKSGHIAVDFLPDPTSGTFEGAIEKFSNAWNPHQYPNSFIAALEALKDEYQAWLEKMPEVPKEFGAAAELAAYVGWESIVAPEGHLTRPAMLMSKNWMTNVWSWDHCFNAMALIFENPLLAWDQYMLFIDNQNRYGAFPDWIDDQSGGWTITKPLIHGWAIEWMMKRSQWIDLKRLAEVYEPLARWTGWYFKYRDSDHDGLPEYNNGMDSGWDNSTVFLMRPPFETPDLAAYLVIQMNTLSDIAYRLGKSAAAEKWKGRADLLLRRMLAKFWREDHFVALEAGNYKAGDSESLQIYLPIVLGRQLPQPVRAKLIAGLTRKGRFLTEHGLASESLQSPYYTPDGYWRGPIWAPTSMIIAEELDAAGEHELARELRRRFCRMVARSGMSENFDAISGRGLRDPAYTWTSSVFLIFAHELLGSAGDQQEQPKHSGRTSQD